jgi:hypothetical protein
VFDVILACFKRCDITSCIYAWNQLTIGGFSFVCKSACTKLMGNNNSSTTTYGQVPVTIENQGDPEDKEDLTFVFHTTDDDCLERVVHDNDSGLVHQDIPYSVSFHGKTVAQRSYFDEGVMMETLLPQLEPGDAVELINYESSCHWVLYIGNKQCIHLSSDGQIKQDLISDVSINCKTRVVNEVYTFKVLPLVQILHNASSQVGRSSMWGNSECFTMWCRTGLPEFTLNEGVVRNLDLTPNKRSSPLYTLELKDSLHSFPKSFSSLSELVEFRKTLEIAKSNDLCDEE